MAADGYSVGKNDETSTEYDGGRVELTVGAIVVGSVVVLAKVGPNEVCIINGVGITEGKSVITTIGTEVGKTLEDEGNADDTLGSSVGESVE